MRNDGQPLTNRMVQLAFGSAVAVLLLVGGLSYRSIVVTSENNYRVQHTHEVLENLGNCNLRWSRSRRVSAGFSGARTNPISIAIVSPD